jgi:hypothetical protein
MSTVSSVTMTSVASVSEATMMMSSTVTSAIWECRDSA